jgi:hypothetical protein
MAVTSTIFGAVRLTREDAQKFKSQMTHGRTRKEATATYVRGKALAAEYVSQGYVVLKRPV